MLHSRLRLAHWFLFGCWLLWAGGAILAQGSRADTASAIHNVFWQPDTVVQGSPLLITVEMSRAAVRVTGTLGGKRLRFFRRDKPGMWYALAGIDLNDEPGNFDLHVNAVLRNRRVARAVKNMDVQAANFGDSAVQVPENYVQPNAQEEKQIARDVLLKKHAFAHLAPRPLWNGDFLKPLEAPDTPTFGQTRLLNEERTSRHLGTDFPVKEGTPVAAANNGVVVLAAPLYYEGNCVILDHGNRFFTIYMHLSRMDVRYGQRVRKGAQIGLSGATGRVTGPHLHLGVRWNGAYLDPLALLKLTLPEVPKRAR